MISKKTKRSKSKKKQPENTNLKEEKFEKSNTFTSHEGYGKKNIINLISPDQTNFSILPEPPSSMSLFERKEKAQEYFEENKYNIEDLLNYDNTNKNIQKHYLKYAVTQLNKVNDLEMKNIIKEKIQKCGIILSKEEYEEEINFLNNHDKNDLPYINYKSNLITCLKYINETKGNDIKKARELLNIKRKYNFNQEAEIGESNYYFYLLALQLDLKLAEFSKSYFYYKYIIDKSIDFLSNKNFSELLENDIYIFDYITEILVDKKSIAKKEQLREVINFLEGVPVNPENLENTIKNKMSERASKIMEKEYITYKLNYDVNSKTIDYFIYEDLKIDRRNYKNEHKISYPYEIFNKEIINTINYLKVDSFEYFEFNIFQNILCDSKYSETFYKEIKPEINKIVKNILNSKAAKKYFNDTYKKKYSNLEYHFNNENVQNTILKKIKFYPFFKKSMNAFTNPVDMSIHINSIPGRFSDTDDIPLFNKKILNISRIVLFLVHEILGHYMRRYYSYLTNMAISMNTKEDNKIDTKPEGGFYVEKKFLGFQDSHLYLRNALSFFYYNGFEDYPIVKGGKFEVTEEKLKNIINDNPSIFDFILKEKEQEIKNDKKGKERKINKIGKDKNEEEKGKDKEGREKKDEGILEEEGKYEGIISKKVGGLEESNKIEDDDNNEKIEIIQENNENKITFNQYYNTFIPINTVFPSIVSCGRVYGEYILL